MTPIASPELDEQLDLEIVPDVPWQIVVWDDPVNLQNYVVRVFCRHFGYSRERATHHMLQVHHDGSSVLAEGPRELMELHAHAMHDYGLQATVRKAHT